MQDNVAQDIDAIKLSERNYSEDNSETASQKIVKNMDDVNAV